MTLEKFKTVIKGYKEVVEKADMIYAATGLDFISMDIWKLWEDLFDNTLELCFGKIALEEVWKYILDDETQFETIEELYQFVSDKRVEWISKNPTSLSKLREYLPEDKMLETFEEITKQVSNESDKIHPTENKLD